MQRINDDDQESYMGLANDQEDIDDKPANFDSDKGLSKVATDGKLVTIKGLETQGL